MFEHLTEDQRTALREIVDEWIADGFTTPPYTAAQYDIFEALDLAKDVHGGRLSYDTRRPDDDEQDPHDHACCPPGECCGGPCAAHPCWELTT